MSLDRAEWSCKSNFCSEIPKQYTEICLSQKPRGSEGPRNCFTRLLGTSHPAESKFFFLSTDYSTTFTYAKNKRSQANQK